MNLILRVGIQDFIEDAIDDLILQNLGDHEIEYVFFSQQLLVYGDDAFNFVDIVIKFETFLHDATKLLDFVEVANQLAGLGIAVGFGESR